MHLVGTKVWQDKRMRNVKVLKGISWRFKPWTQDRCHHQKLWQQSCHHYNNQLVNPLSYPCSVSDLPWYSKVQNTITMTRPVFDTLTRPSIPQTNWAIHWARYKERRVLNKFDFDNGILFQCMSISISWKANPFTSWFKVWRNRCVCTSQIEMVPSVDPVAANASLFCNKSANHPIKSLSNLHITEISCLHRVAMILKSTDNLCYKALTTLVMYI